MTKFFFPICICVFVAGCAHKTPVSTPIPPDREITRIIGMNEPDSKLRQQAERFAQLVTGKMTDEEKNTLISECEKNSQGNVFCHSIQKKSTFEKRLIAWNQVPSYPGARVITPTDVVIEKGRIKDWQHIRKVSIKSILKGLSGKSFDELRLVQRGLKRRGCPDPVSPALAAMLEDHFPEKIKASEVSSLYEKGAYCAASNPNDREHFLTRAGLLHYWAKDTAKARYFFRLSSRTKDAFAARALYWLYRVQSETKHDKAAKKTLATLLEKYPLSFHTLLILTLSQSDPARDWLKNETIEFNMKRSLKNQGANQFIEQAEALRMCGYENEAAFIVSWASDELRTIEPEVRLYLAWLGDGYAKITTTNDLLAREPRQINRKILELYFPKPFNSFFEKHAGSLDPLLLFAIARQESTFNTRALSPANARGLLQIHPDTSLRLSGKPDIDLFNPESNIQLAARYMTELLTRYFGKLYLAVGAYNAGEDKVQAWQTRYIVDDPVLFIDLLSYRETRNYIAAVLRNYFWYRRIYQNQVPARVIDNVAVLSPAERGQASGVPLDSDAARDSKKE